MSRATLERLLLAAVVVVVVVVAAATAAEAARRRDGFAPAGGPYGMQLTDSPHYYPHYRGREYTTWDVDGRCATYCRAAEDGGCAVACR